MAGDVGDDEAAWRDLIARFSTATADDTEPAPWPDREDLTVPEPEPGISPAGPAGPAGPKPEPVPAGDPEPGPGTPGSGQDVPGSPGRARIVRRAVPSFPSPDPAAADDDDHYVPPPPPPLPSLDPVAKGAWAALFGGPAYLLLAVMAGWDIPGWAAFSAVAAFVAGFTTLVVRMGDQPPRDSGPDDGAVV